MNNPRVVRLHYHVRPHPSARLNPDADTSWNTSEGVIAIKGNTATVELVQHFPTEEEAKVAIQPYLDSWEAWAGLTSAFDQGPFTFAFTRADVIDLAPAPNDPLRVHMNTLTSATAEAEVIKYIDAIPEPPGDFRSDEAVNRMWNRWIRYRAGQESIASMAYYCLTEVEAGAGRTGQEAKGARAQAAKKYAIDRSVLDRLGDLVSEVGADDEARKRFRKEQRPFTPEERRWIESSIKKLIVRVGEVHARPNQSFSSITVEDLR